MRVRHNIKIRRQPLAGHLIQIALLEGIVTVIVAPRPIGDITGAGGMKKVLDAVIAPFSATGAEYKNQAET